MTCTRRPPRLAHRTVVAPVVRSSASAAPSSSRTAPRTGLSLRQLSMTGTGDTRNRSRRLAHIRPPADREHTFLRPRTAVSQTALCATGEVVRNVRSCAQTEALRVPGLHDDALEHRPDDGPRVLAGDGAGTVPLPCVCRPVRQLDARSRAAAPVSPFLRIPAPRMDSSGYGRQEPAPWKSALRFAACSSERTLAPYSPVMFAWSWLSTADCQA